jgi:hypothetical protein
MKQRRREDAQAEDDPMEPYQRSERDAYERPGESSGGDFGQQVLNLGTSFVTYLKTRQPEHWLFFAVGVIFGLWIG